MMRIGAEAVGYAILRFIGTQNSPFANAYDADAATGWGRNRMEVAAKRTE